MAVTISWRQALAWRMGRHYLDPLADVPVEAVVRRLCGVQAQVASSAELAVEVRQRDPHAGAVARAIADGRLLKTWAMRGSLHLVTPEEGGAFLSLMASGRTWERPSWVHYFGVTPSVMEAFRAAVREALEPGPLTREELVATVATRPGLEHIADGLASGWGTLLKPLAWQGDLCFGPSRGTRVTFMRPEAASSRWAGVPDPEEAAPVAVRLLPGFDQYVLGPGTADEHVIPAARRSDVSRQSGWISPVVVVDGRVQGTWRVDGSGIVIDWFQEAERPPADVLVAENARIAAILDVHDPTIRVGAPNGPAAGEIPTGPT